MNKNIADIAKSCQGKPEFQPEKVAEKSAAAAAFAQWLLKIADAADAQEKQRKGMPAAMKAPKTAEEL